MKDKNGLSYMQVVLVAILVELTLVAIQFAYLRIYASSNEGVEFAFTPEYLKTRGFFIFQIIGFFLYTFVTYVLVGRISSKILNKLVVLVVAGGIVELSFYIFMSGDYEGAFVYSILDKIIAVVFGLILFNYTTERASKPDSYL